MTVLKSVDTFSLTLVLQICILSVLLSLAGGQVSPCQSVDIAIGCTGMADGYYPLAGSTTSYVTCTSGTATVVTCDPSIGGPCYDCAKQACSAQPCTPALPPGGTIIDCGSPPTPPNNFTQGPALVDQTTTYMSQAVFTCSPKYWFQAGVYNFSSTCQSTGQWQPTPPPCVESKCDIPTAPKNGWVYYSPLDVGANAMFGCYPGYWNTIRLFPVLAQCQDNGQWQSVLPCVCTIRSSKILLFRSRSAIIAVHGHPTPPGLPNAYYTQLIEYAAIYICLPGYQFSDDTTAQMSTCPSSSNVWSSVPSCVPIDCGQPAVTPAYATMITSTNMSTTYQSNVTYQCDIGYWVANSVFTATTTCQADGTWSAVPDCSPLTCGVPPTVLNSTSSPANMTSSVLNSNVTYTCNTGYMLSPNVFKTTITCQATGFWSAQPSCTPIDCGQPPIIPNGQPTQIYGSSSPPMSTVTYSCNNGYFIKAGVLNQTITCLNNGLWSAQRNCTPVLCTPTYNVFIRYTTTPVLANLTIGSSLTASCGYGVYFNANKPATATETCKSDGTWLPPLACLFLGVRTRIYGATYGTYFDYMEARTQSGGNLFNVRAYYTTTSITGMMSGYGNPLASIRYYMIGKGSTTIWLAASNYNFVVYYTYNQLCQLSAGSAAASFFLPPQNPCPAASTQRASINYGGSINYMFGYTDGTAITGLGFAYGG